MVTSENFQRFVMIKDDNKGQIKPSLVVEQEVFLVDNKICYCCDAMKLIFRCCAVSLLLLAASIIIIGFSLSKKMRSIMRILIMLFHSFAHQTITNVRRAKASCVEHQSLKKFCWGKLRFNHFIIYVTKNLRCA